MLPRPFALTCALLVVVADARGQSPAHDLYGDPLPKGAVARLGTVRLRHDSPIVFAAFLPGGNSVLSVGNDGLACIWEFPSGKELHRFAAHLADERPAVPAPKAAQIPSPPDGDGPPVPVVPAVAAASLSPDGKHLIAFCTDGFVRIWDWANAKQLGKAAAGDPGDARYAAPVGAAGSAAAGPIYAPDGKALLFRRSPRTLQIVDVPTGKDLGPLAGHSKPVTAIAFTPDGRQLRTSDGTSARRWDAATGKELAAAAINVKLTADLRSAVTYKMTKDKNGVITKKAYNTLGASPVVISPDSRFGVTVSRFASPAEANAAKERAAVLFDAATGEKLADIGIEVIGAPLHPKPLVFSPDGALLAVNAGADKEKIDLYAVPSGKRLHTFETDLADPQAGLGAGLGGIKVPVALARTRGGQGMLFSADGKRLAFSPGLNAAIVVFDTKSGKQIGSLPNIEGSLGLQGAFSADGRCLILERTDGTVTFFELATGQPRRSYGTKRPVPPASPADDALGPFGGFAAFSTVVTTSAILRTSLAVSPDDRLLAIVGPGGSIRVWDVLTGMERAVFIGHTLTVNALAFAPDGKTLASAGDDATAFVWDVAMAAQATPQTKPANLDTAWQALADNDAAKAFVAMADFAAAPDAAVNWIKDRVKPAPFDAKRALDLLKQLDHADFKARERASDELLKFGDAVVPLLAKAVAAEPPLEARRRLDDLLNKITNRRLQGEPLRAYRAIEILERIGTPEARAVLQLLTGASR